MYGVLLFPENGLPGVLLEALQSTKCAYQRLIGATERGSRKCYLKKASYYDPGLAQSQRNWKSTLLVWFGAGQLAEGCTQATKKGPGVTRMLPGAECSAQEAPQAQEYSRAPSGSLGVGKQDERNIPRPCTVGEVDVTEEKRGLQPYTRSTAGKTPGVLRRCAGDFSSPAAVPSEAPR